MQAAMAEIVGKKDLCAAMGWTRPWLDRRLKSDRHFPIHKIGDQSGGWEFDLEAVRAHFGGEQQEIGSKPSAPAAPVAKAKKGIDPAQLRDVVKPPLPRKAEETAVQVVDALKKAPEQKPGRRSAYHSGEASARQRKDEADAALKEDKLREARGELVQKREIGQALNAVILQLGQSLDALPERIAKMLEREDLAPSIRALIDQIRTEMVNSAEPLLEPPA